MKIKLYILTTFIFLFGMIPTTTEAATNQTVYQQVDNYIAKEMKAANIPGMAIGIVKDNKIVHVSGYNNPSYPARVITAQTPFILGSTSKSITAMAIMQLKEEGKINLTAPIRTYLPNLKNVREANEITVRDLLIQASGIPKSASIDHLNGIHDKHIGNTFEYANANYELLGEIIEEVTGLSYGEYVTKYIFSPLNMNHTFVSQDRAEQAGLATGYRTWFGFNIPSTLAYPKDTISAGYIISSAEDMTHYLIAQMNEGQFHNSQLLSKDSIDAMHTPAISAPMYGANNDYGMGWFVGQNNGEKVFQHPGEVANYHSTMKIFPKEHIGFILLANVNNEFVTSGNVEQIGDGVASILAGNKPIYLDPGQFWKTYSIVDAVFGFLIILTIFHVLFAIRWMRRFSGEKWIRASFSILCINAVLPLAVLIGLPKFIQLSWPFFMDFAPETYVLLGLTIILLLLGLIKGSYLIKQLYKNSKARPVMLSGR